MILETKHLVLRRWKPDDRRPFAALNSDPAVMEFMPKVLSRAESDAMTDRIAAHFDAHGYGLYALELKETGEFIGYTGLAQVPFESSFTPAVEIGWRLARKYWGNGYAPEAARAVAAHASGKLKMQEIVSFTVPLNLRSRRVMEKTGMSHDPTGDFAHPKLPADHVLSRHVLYRLKI